MRMSLRADTKQCIASGMQLGPVQTYTTWSGPVRFNRDELMATQSHTYRQSSSSINIIFNQF